MEEGYKVRFVASVIQASKEFMLNKHCNSWLARNTGDTVVRVNQAKLLPRILPGLSGESIGIKGDQGDIQEGPLSINFDTTGGGTAPEVNIVQAVYLIKEC